MKLSEQIEWLERMLKTGILVENYSLTSILASLRLLEAAQGAIPEYPTVWAGFGAMRSVKVEDYAALRAHCVALAQENDLLKADAEVMQQNVNFLAHPQVSVRSLISKFESASANTDTDWRWKVASALRLCQHPDTTYIDAALKERT